MNKKYYLPLSIGLFFLVGCNNTNSSSGATSSSVEPNNNTYFGVLSDIHLQSEDLTSVSYFKNAINRFKYEAEKDGGSLSGIIIAGDICDSTWYKTLQYEDVTYENDKEHRDAQLNFIGNVFNETIPEDIPLLYSLGNHDNSASYYDHSTGLGYEVLCGQSSRKYRDIFETIRPEFFSFDDEVDHSGLKLSKDEMVDKGLRLAHLNNTHIVMVNNNTYYHVSNSYTEEALNWVDGTLRFLNRMYANDPIFVVTHNPVSDTILGSTEDNASTDLQKILIKYPNTLTLSGHIHYDNYSEYALDGNKGFLTLDTTCCKMANPTHYADKNHLGSDDKEEYDVQYANLNTNSSEGNLLVIDEEGATTIKRLDFLCNSYSGPDWNIPAPLDENRVSKFTTEERLKVEKAPFFDSNAKVEVNRIGDYLNITWNKALAEKLPTYAYRVDLYNQENNLVEDILVSSAKNVREDVPLYSISYKDSSREITLVKVTAENSLYQKSEPISATYESFLNNETPIYVNERRGDNLSTLGNVKYGENTLYASTQFNVNTDSIDNYKTAHARGSIFFDAVEKNYSFSYRISSSRCNKGHTSYGNSQADYALGACLASYVYNNRQISLVATMTFSLGGTTRTVSNKITYRLLLTTIGGSTWSYAKELTDLSTSLTGADAIKTKLESDTGAIFKVSRSGSSFSLYLDDVLLDSKDLAKNYYHHNTYMPFSAETPSTFGIFTYGGEARFDQFNVTF